MIHPVSLLENRQTDFHLEIRIRLITRGIIEMTSTILVIKFRTLPDKIEIAERRIPFDPLAYRESASLIIL